MNILQRIRNWMLVMPLIIFSFSCDQLKEKSDNVSFRTSDAVGKSSAGEVSLKFPSWVKIDRNDTLTMSNGILTQTIDIVALLVPGSDDTQKQGVRSQSAFSGNQVPAGEVISDEVVTVSTGDISFVVAGGTPEIDTVVVLDAGDNSLAVNKAASAGTNIVLVNSIVADGDLKVSYVTQVSGLLDTFGPLADLDDANTVEVVLTLANGDPLPVFSPGDYTVNGANNVVFNPGNLPPAGAVVNVNFKTSIAEDPGVPLTDTFAFSPDILARSVIDNSVTVTVEDMPINRCSNVVIVDCFNFDAGLNQVQFNTRPPDGAKIVLGWTEDRGPTKEYNIIEINNNPRAFSAIFGEIEIPLEYEEGKITFSGPDFAALIPGNQVLVTFKNELTIIENLKLVGLPVEGTVTLEREGFENLCENGGSDFFTELDLLTLNCEFPDNATITLSYKYWQKNNLEPFVIDEVENSADGTWKVLIAGEETTSYIRTENQITVTGDLPFDSDIEILFIPNR